MHRTRSLPRAALAAAQDGAVCRRQLVALGVTPATIAAQVAGGRWQRLLPGVYASFTGPVPARTRAWAAVLYAGPGAVLGGAAALWLSGVDDEPPGVVPVCVPWSRKVEVQPGLRVVRCRDLDARRHPAAAPPRLRLEDAVLDVAESGDDGRAIEVVLRATQRRLTTAPRLREALAARSRHARRPLLADLLAEVVDGVQSPLERRYLRGVERPHGLPRSQRNRTERVAGGGGRTVNRYRDNRYRRWQLVVELDGDEAHPSWRRHRDRRRDARVLAHGDLSMEYGWYEVVTDPCGVAAEVAAVLTRQGWPGTPRRCGSGCTVLDPVPG